MVQQTFKKTLPLQNASAILRLIFTTRNAESYECSLRLWQMTEHQPSSVSVWTFAQQPQRKCCMAPPRHHAHLVWVPIIFFRNLLLIPSHSHPAMLDDVGLPTNLKIQFNKSSVTGGPRIPLDRAWHKNLPLAQGGQQRAKQIKNGVFHVFPSSLQTRMFRKGQLHLLQKNT